ncbi:M14-type cytosolic carboxypeptidase [uncultured Umboniibacter sp.]|uniref:M14 family metallopeptidase n=1 Tax=uncultured Umboniibacter sp. TaxID=1798917 RepID=UPI002623A9AE|nr:M14-type cytosolic carboxypeptidase [uncultured Umboniibacter sp.]
MFSVNSNFDSGNIHLAGESNGELLLEIRQDRYSEYFQWFHFSVSGDQGSKLQCCIRNAGQAAYLEGWPDYRVCFSYDRKTWHRLDTNFDGQNLRFETQLEGNTIWFAYFEPFSYERHLELVGRAQQHDEVTHEILGLTLDGRPIDLLQIGTPADAKPIIWVTARQHPGESMAEHLVEGLLNELLSDSELGKALRSQAVFYIIPNMNPDGSVRGHLRTNAAGMNLNREWQSPSKEKSPEVFWARSKMISVGGDMFLDIHGDEALPYNFVAASEGVANYSAYMAELENAFRGSLLQRSDQFQTEYGYDIDAPGKANHTVGSNWMGNHFKTLALTLEMPFKDNANDPCSRFGWNGERSQQLGKDMLATVLDLLPHIKRG